MKQMNHLFYLQISRTHDTHEDADVDRLVSAPNILQALGQIAADYFSDADEADPKKWHMVSGQRPRARDQSGRFIVDQIVNGLAITFRRVTVDEAVGLYFEQLEALNKRFLPLTED